MIEHGRGKQMKNVFLQILACPLYEEIKEILGQFWLPPHELEKSVYGAIRSSNISDIVRVIVSGETHNTTLYVICDDQVLAITPFSHIEDNTIFKEFHDVVQLSHGSYSIFHLNDRLDERLNLPKVALINPCVIENFPVPRLSLSIGLLGAMLRKEQAAQVRIFDMQMDLSTDVIQELVLNFGADIVGISISYGQLNIAEEIIAALYDLIDHDFLSCDVVVGNIIPASNPDYFLKKYPKLTIAMSEGEYTIIDLVKHFKGKISREEIRNIAYLADGKIVRTFGDAVQMSDIPLPALDTLPDLAQRKGALTLETSRGCQWNVCTFCPREHKSSSWKVFSNAKIIEYFQAFSKVCDIYGIPKRLFLADEEFIGGENDNDESERVSDLANKLILSNLSFEFDAAARVDQVYVPKNDLKWHLDRMHMWHMAHNAGMYRLFLGVESGSDSQLRRYGKGINTEQSIIAIRIITGLGIPLRFGFITFDPLMEGFKEIKENIYFLERTDAFMKPLPIDKLGYEQVFKSLLEDEDFVQSYKADIPIYSSISYMLASMEVLINSRYRMMVKNAERLRGKSLIINEDNPDVNMGRYTVRYVNSVIEQISISSQKWIDRHFGLAYTVKSLYKTAPPNAKSHLMQWMVDYRKTSLELLKSFVCIFDEDEEDVRTFIHSIEDRDLVSLLQYLRQNKTSIPLENIIVTLMNKLDDMVLSNNHLLFSRLQGATLSDNAMMHLDNSFKKWEQKTGKWMLINNPIQM